MSDQKPPDDTPPLTTALASTEVFDLIESSNGCRAVPPHLRPRASLPGQELLRMLGDELVCRIVLELENIFDRGASTHIDLRIHTHEGLPRRAELVHVQPFTIKGEHRKR